MSRIITTFPETAEFQRAQAALEALRLSHEVIEPGPGYARVGVPALVVEAEARLALAHSENAFVCSGWVEYRPAQMVVPLESPPEFAEDTFGRAAIMVLAPCVADLTKIRLIAHISGDLTEVFPYMNAVMETAAYNRNGPTFTFMERYRMISVYPHRMTVAKADEIIDAWRALEMIRCRANEVWARRHEIQPSYVMRRKPPALEIFKRLPRTNCRACGEPTCLAFACQVYTGMAAVAQCTPVFRGPYGRLRDALVEICQGLGVSESAPPA